MRRLHLLAALVLAAGLTTASCSSASDACTDVTQAVLDGIADGINTDGVTISTAGAVPSGDGLIVAGTLTGPGIDDEVTGWTVGRTDPPGSITSADSLAAEFTNWPLKRADLDEAETCLN